MKTSSINKVLVFLLLVISITGSLVFANKDLLQGKFSTFNPQVDTQVDQDQSVLDTETQTHPDLGVQTSHNDGSSICTGTFEYTMLGDAWPFDTLAEIVNNDLNSPFYSCKYKITLDVASEGSSHDGNSTGVYEADEVLYRETDLGLTTGEDNKIVFKEKISSGNTDLGDISLYLTIYNYKIDVQIQDDPNAADVDEYWAWSNIDFDYKGEAYSMDLNTDRIEHNDTNYDSFTVEVSL